MLEVFWDDFWEGFGRPKSMIFKFQWFMRFKMKLHKCMLNRKNSIPGSPVEPLYYIELGSHTPDPRVGGWREALWRAGSCISVNLIIEEGVWGGRWGWVWPIRGRRFLGSECSVILLPPRLAHKLPRGADELFEPGGWREALWLAGSCVSVNIIIEVGVWGGRWLRF